MPILVATLMTIVQVALYAYASRLVEAAAREGTRTVRLVGHPDAGRERAATFLSAHGAKAVLAPVVDAKTVAGVASVVVSGQAVSVVPGLHLAVTARSSGPVEAFVPAGGGR
jgi:TadE-like protein